MLRIWDHVCLFGGWLLWRTRHGKKELSVQLYVYSGPDAVVLAHIVVGIEICV